MKSPSTKASPRKVRPTAAKPVAKPATAAPSQATQIDRQAMGHRIREVRKGCALTLKQLSEKCGVSLPTLSKMELGQVSISYEKFAAVALSLGIDIAQLFQPEPKVKAARKIKPTIYSRSSLESTPNYISDHYDHHLLANDFLDKSMTPAYSRIRARSMDEFEGYGSHPGQEFLLVLSGAIQLCFESGETVALKKSEWIYFDSGTGHAYLSTSKKDAQILLVMTRLQTPT
ncbi:XRE family transcriptional regulator [Variovorax rhizosphaerae]|uniref:XRE family transcriptional regulator n=1 Tax=Variovorax rhizosphaerae TaxID=1836200 RepID=A0ABU8WJF9_9BURK